MFHRICITIILAMLAANIYCNTIEQPPSATQRNVEYLTSIGLFIGDAKYDTQDYWRIYNFRTSLHFLYPIKGRLLLRSGISYTRHLYTTKLSHPYNFVIEADCRLHNTRLSVPFIVMLNGDHPATNSDIDSYIGGGLGLNSNILSEYTEIRDYISYEVFAYDNDVIKTSPQLNTSAILLFGLRGQNLFIEAVLDLDLAKTKLHSTGERRILLHNSGLSVGMTF